MEVYQVVPRLLVFCEPSRNLEEFCILQVTLHPQDLNEDFIIAS